MAPQIALILAIEFLVFIVLPFVAIALFLFALPVLRCTLFDRALAR